MAGMDSPTSLFNVAVAVAVADMTPLSILRRPDIISQLFEEKTVKIRETSIAIARTNVHFLHKT
jgi:hypothetical protein